MVSSRPIRNYGLSIVALIIVVIVGIAILLEIASPLRSSDAPTPIPSSYSPPLSGQAAQQALAQARQANPQTLSLPSGQVLQLKTYQDMNTTAPVLDNKAAPAIFVLNYSDGTHNVAVQQGHSVAVSFEPGNRTADPVRTQTTVRNGLPATYIEFATKQGNYSELAWHEGDWYVTVQAWNSDQAYLTQVANDLTR